MVSRNSINPVYIRIQIGVISRTCFGNPVGIHRRLSGIIQYIIQQLHIIGSPDIAGKFYRLRERKFRFHHYPRLTHMSALGINQNHTIRTTYTIHCTGSRIFQYGERLDFFYINIIQATFNTIYQHQWVFTHILKGTDTTDPKRRVIVSRFSGTLHTNHTCHCASQIVTQ